MFRKLSFASSSSNVNKEKVKSLKQTSLASKSLSSAPDDLDDVAVISCNPDSQITYGSRGLCALLLFKFYYFFLFSFRFLLTGKQNFFLQVQDGGRLCETL